MENKTNRLKEMLYAVLVLSALGGMAFMAWYSATTWHELVDAWVIAGPSGARVVVVSLEPTSDDTNDELTAIEVREVATDEQVAWTEVARASDPTVVWGPVSGHFAWVQHETGILTASTHYRRVDVVGGTITEIDGKEIDRDVRHAACAPAVAAFRATAATVVPVGCAGGSALMLDGEKLIRGDATKTAWTVGINELGPGRVTHATMIGDAVWVVSADKKSVPSTVTVVELDAATAAQRNRYDFE